MFKEEIKERTEIINNGHSPSCLCNDCTGKEKPSIKNVRIVEAIASSIITSLDNCDNNKAYYLSLALTKVIVSG